MLHECYLHFFYFFLNLFLYADAVWICCEGHKFIIFLFKINNCMAAEFFFFSPVGHLQSVRYSWLFWPKLSLAIIWSSLQIWSSCQIWSSLQIWSRCQVCSSCQILYFIFMILTLCRLIPNPLLPQLIS